MAAQRGETAIKLVKYLISERSLSFSNSGKRELGNTAKAIGVDFEELKNLLQPIFHELIDECFEK